MIRPSLERAIKDTLQKHVYLDGSEFILKQYENQNCESCLRISFRHNPNYSFVFEVKKKEDSPERYVFDITMNPGVAASEETAVAAGHMALLQELRAWHQRLDEDAGHFPVSRQLQAHLSVIDRLRGRLALMPEDIPAQLDRRKDILDDLDRSHLRLERYVSALQVMRQNIFISTAKLRLRAIEGLKKRIESVPVDVPAKQILCGFCDSFGPVSNEIRSLIEYAISDKKKMEQGQLCLHDGSDFMPAIHWFETHRRHIDLIQDDVASIAGSAFHQQDGQRTLMEELKSYNDRLHRDIDGLRTFFLGDVLKRFKQHVIDIDEMRDRFERIADNPLNSEDVSRIYNNLDQIKKEVTTVFADHEAQKQKDRKFIREELQSKFRKEREDQQARYGQAIAFLEEKVRKMESTAGNFLEVMMNPNYAQDKAEAWKEQAVIRTIEERLTLCTAIGILKKDMEASEKFWNVLNGPL